MKRRGEGSTPNPFTWNGAYGYEYNPATGFYHVGAREYDPRTARWLQRDPAGAAGGHPNLYIYPRNDPINWFDVGGQQHTKKTLEECEKILSDIESRLKELSRDVENALQGKSPLEDLQGNIGSPGGHMCELEQRIHGISLLWKDFFNAGCDEFEELRLYRKLHERFENLQRRVSKWVRQLEGVSAKLIRKLIQGIKNPEVRKWVIRFLRRMAKFVPYIGHIITIIFFIYDWYTGGFWNAVKGLVADARETLREELHKSSSGRIFQWQQEICVLHGIRFYAGV